MTIEKPGTVLNPAGSTFRYQLLAVPDGEIAGRVLEERKEFIEIYCQEMPAGIPSVTVCEFMAREEMEETIIRWLQRITSDLKSFDITLNNYSGVPSHTVFLRVQEAGVFREFAGQMEPIDQYVRSYDCPPVRFARHPHMAIAENLPGWLYEQVISEYSRRDFHGSFEVKELMLVRTGPGGETVRRAVLRLQPVMSVC